VPQGLEFHPWWESREFITPRQEKTAVALYRRGKEWLVIVCNFAETPVDEVLTLDLKKMGPPRAAITGAVDDFQGEPMAVQGDRLIFPIQAKDFRMIRVRVE
jgi:hypothetical protein